jgi:hypothetical protein
MEHTKVLKRAWHMVTKYRALWIFGVILALTTASASNPFTWRANDNGRNNNNQSYNGSPITLEQEPFSQLQSDMDQASREMVRLFDEGIPAPTKNLLIGLAIGLSCLVLVIIVVGTGARYVSETSLIRMVDSYEATGEQIAARGGWRLGWSRQAWRLFLIDLLIDVPVTLAFILLFALAAAPVLLTMNSGTGGLVFGIVLTIGLGFLFIFAAIAVAIVLAVLKPFFKREAALNGLGVQDAIRQGYSIVRRHLKDVGLMWLILFGVDVGWPVVMFLVALVLVPLAALVGGLPGLLVGGLTGLFAHGSTALLVGGITGGVIFVIVFVGTLVVLEGLKLIFQSSTWTLTYRQLLSAETGPAGSGSAEALAAR